MKLEDCKFKFYCFLRYFSVALRFLTILPFPELKEERKTDFSLEVANSTPFFPLVGFFIGILLFFIYFAFGFLSSDLLSLILLSFWIFVTGALHIDGFADMIDGLSGGKDRKEILQIMQDAHLGAKGVAGVFLFLLLKFILIKNVASSSNALLFIFSPCAGRWGMVVGSSVIPYAKKKGMAEFSSFTGLKEVLLSTFIAAVLGVLILGFSSLFLLLITGGFCLLFSLYLKKRMGGFTGDTLGALGEMEEALVLLAGFLLARSI